MRYDKISAGCKYSVGDFLPRTKLIFEFSPLCAFVQIAKGTPGHE